MKMVGAGADEKKCRLRIPAQGEGKENENRKAVIGKKMTNAKQMGSSLAYWKKNLQLRQQHTYSHSSQFSMLKKKPVKYSTLCQSCDSHSE